MTISRHPKIAFPPNFFPTTLFFSHRSARRSSIALSKTQQRKQVMMSRFDLLSPNLRPRNKSVTPDQDATTSRKQRPSGVYEPGMFCHVTSVCDFAQALRVPVSAISLIVVKERVSCKAAGGCPFKAIKGNYDRCPAHGRNWYPLETDRGCDMIAPEFMRFSFDGRHRSCDCSQTTCRAAGYFPGQDALFVKGKGREVVLATPNLFDTAKRREFEENKQKKLYLYPWHFFANDLRRNKTTGLLELNWDKDVERVYKDLELRRYSSPPPT